MPDKEDEEKPLDGVSMFDAWVAGGSTVEGVDAPRSELLVNINSAIFGGSGALHVGEYKLMVNPEPSESKIYAKTRKALAAKEGVLEPEEFQSILTIVHAEVLGSAEKYIFNIRWVNIYLHVNSLGLRRALANTKHSHPHLIPTRFLN